MKKFLRPLDWFPLEAKLRQYARAARKDLPVVSRRWIDVETTSYLGFRVSIGSGTEHGNYCIPARL